MTVLPPLTRLEWLIQARINLWVFGFYIGTGHHIANQHAAERAADDTDDDESSSDDFDENRF
jgi:hypothetical protein